MSNDPIKRLENNHYAMEKAFKRLQIAIESRDDHEIYAATGETLLWLITTEDWHFEHTGKDKYKKCRNKDKDGVILLGLRHAYNMMKHNMDFIQIHRQKGGISFPIQFPLNIPPITVCWRETGDGLNGIYEYQKDDYVKYIEGREVIKTFSQAIKFLKGRNFNDNR